MVGDPLDGLARLVEEGVALTRGARLAGQVSAPPGSDSAGAVSVTLDPQGRVARVSVVTGWRRRLGAEGLPDAVIEAVRDASMRRLTAWGQVYGEQTADEPGPPARSGTAAAGEPAGFDRDDFGRRLHAATSGRRMSEEDRRAALSELLALAEAIERGIDEVSGKLRVTLEATHTGRSPDRHVTVTMTGGGDVTAVRCDRAWLRDAHEVNIGRQITAALQAAAQNVAAQGVRRLITDSALGEVQEATQDPFGLARRLRLTD